MYVVIFYNLKETHWNLSFLDNEIDGNKKLPNIQCLLASILMDTHKQSCIRTKKLSHWRWFIDNNIVEKYLITWNVSRTPDLVK
jgi:hypothetical protein